MNEKDKAAARIANTRGFVELERARLIRYVDHVDTGARGKIDLMEEINGAFRRVQHYIKRDGKPLPKEGEA